MPAATADPLYKKVADDLRQQIATGQLEVKDEIPSTAKLAKQHGVSIGVVRTAVRLLQEEGLLIGQPGRGVYVRATPATVADEASAMKTAEEQIDELRHEVERLAEQQPADVTAKIEELQVQVGRLQADLRHLYDRLGQPYPHGQSTPKPKRRTSGA